MRKLVELMCIFILSMSLTACSAEDALVDILSKAISKAMEENQERVPEQEMETVDSATEQTEDTGEPEADQSSQSTEMTDGEAETHTAVTMDMMQLYECWSKVVGYWNAAEGRYAVPDMMDSHTAVFRYGIWDTEADSGEGMVTELQASGEQELTALVYYAAQEATELRDAVEETTISVVIDYSGLEQDGKIRIKIGEADWNHYMFAGNTSQEAYQTYIDNTFGAD